MYQEQEDVYYYITLGNENYEHPPMPKGVEEGIVKGIYPLKTHETQQGQHKVQLFGSASILRETLRAQEILAAEYNYFCRRVEHHLIQGIAAGRA